MGEAPFRNLDPVTTTHLGERQTPGWECLKQEICVGNALLCFDPSFLTFDVHLLCVLEKDGSKKQKVE